MLGPRRPSQELSTLSNIPLPKLDQNEFMDLWNEDPGHTMYHLQNAEVQYVNGVPYYRSLFNTNNLDALGSGAHTVYNNPDKTVLERGHPEKMIYYKSFQGPIGKLKDQNTGQERGDAYNAKLVIGYNYPSRGQKGGRHIESFHPVGSIPNLNDSFEVRGQSPARPRVTMKLRQAPMKKGGRVHPSLSDWQTLINYWRSLNSRSA